MKSMRILAVLLSIGLLAVGCSQEPDMTAPDTQTSYNFDKDGTETLGPPSIDIASGSCFARCTIRRHTASRRYGCCLCSDHPVRGSHRWPGLA